VDAAHSSATKLREELRIRDHAYTENVS